MKLRIISVLSYPFPNKFVITVSRGDGKHIPTTRTYLCDYDNEKIWKLYKRFNIMNAILQKRIIAERCLARGN